MLQPLIGMVLTLKNLSCQADGALKRKGLPSTQVGDTRPMLRACSVLIRGLRPRLGQEFRRNSGVVIPFVLQDVLCVPPTTLWYFLCLMWGRLCPLTAHSPPEHTGKHWLNVRCVRKYNILLFCVCAGQSADVNHRSPLGRSDANFIIDWLGWGVL